MSAPFADLPTTTSAALEELQRAVKISRDARDACVNPLHDHDTTLLADGTTVSDLGQKVNMACWECGEHAHYDLLMEIYYHNDPDALACSEMGPNLVNPCTPD